MKAELVREIEVARGYPFDETRMVMKNILRNGEYVDVPFYVKGAVIDAPNAYLLVKNGIATPADDECKQRANMTPDMMALAQKRSLMVEKGIHPDDYERYENEEIAGYQDGEDIPGINAIPDEENDDDGAYIP